METDKIVLDLNRRFAVPLPEFYERRIIFWHDEEKEYADKLDEIRLENAKLVALTGSNCIARGTARTSHFQHSSSDGTS